jgi:hypothetical protein
VVSAVRICGYQLYKELGLRRFRRRWIMDWRVSLANFIARSREEESHPARLVPMMLRLRREDVLIRRTQQHKDRRRL